MPDSLRVPFSWEDPGVASAQNALVVRQQAHGRDVVAFRNRKRQEQNQLDDFQHQVDDARQIVLRERADNRLEVQKLRSSRLELEFKQANLRKDREYLEKTEKELQVLEEQSKRNRTLSIAFIEDNFSGLSPKDVVDYLTHSSPRLREHAMKNIAFCINGSEAAAPSFVRFKAADIAPFLLPKLEQITSAPKLDDSVKAFSTDVVSTPEMAKALAISGQCPKLGDFLVRRNEFVNRVAISAMRKMMRADGQVVSNLYKALQAVVPHIPVSASPNGEFYPSVEFIREISPQIVADSFTLALWDVISPLVVHKSDAIRQVVLAKVIVEASSSERVQRGLVETGTLRLLEHHYGSSHPPLDIIDFFVSLLPLLAEMMCHDVDGVLWLISRFNDPTDRITNAVATAFHNVSQKGDPVINDNFVKAELLRRLDETPAQRTPTITRLICNLLPALALPHARTKTCSRILAFLDDAETTVADACLMACIKIVDSTKENRADLYSEFSKFSFSKPSTLKLCDHAMPMLCQDWAAMGDFAKIARCLFHQESRVRVAAHRVWHDVVSSTPTARAKIVRDGHLGVIFELCNSQYEDCVIVGCRSLPHMAIDIAKAGTSSTRQLVSLLDHPRLELRQAALQAIQIIAEGGDANCEVLLAADTFITLTSAVDKYPLDGVNNVQKILVHLSPFLSRSYDACLGLLKLLDSRSPEVVSAAYTALNRISYTTIDYRETLRSVIITHLQTASISENVVEFSAKAVREWIGPDLVQLNDFGKLFHLVSHRDRRVQNAVLFALKQKMNGKEYQESLAKADVVSLLRSLSEIDNPEAISFVAIALRSMALILARDGHISDILQLLVHEEPRIQEGASEAIEGIANSSDYERRSLSDELVLERLTGGDECLNQTALKLSVRIIPKLVFDYVGAKKAEFILSLVDHRQEPIHRAAINSVTVIVSGTKVERRQLQDALLPLLGSASASLLDVAQKCLEQALARDLVSELDYKKIFNILEIENPRIRAPVISELARYIHTSTEAVRRDLVDAGILKRMLYACTISKTKEDLHSFMADCLLPVLGPSFIRNDGGRASVIPLLKHEEPRIRAAAAIAIRNGVESPYGSLQNMADARIVSNLHSTMDDDAVRDLWCHVVPKIAPFISSQDEIEILFDGLCDPRDTVRQVASESISLMARTSDETRLRLFPALLARLDGPPDAVIEHVALAVSLSGPLFVSTSNEADLLHIIEYGEPPLMVAAVNAVSLLLSKGSLYEHQKLMEAGIFDVALRFHETGSQRLLSLKLLTNIIRHLTSDIILDEELTEKLLYLFDDPDVNISETLYEALVTLAGNLRASGSAAMLHLLPVLLDPERQRNPFVSRLLSQLAPYMVPHLFELKRMTIVVKLLMAEDDDITMAYLRETHANMRDATVLEKDLLAGEPHFVLALENFLKSQDVATRRISSEIVAVLSERSQSRSAKLMEAGVGSSLAWISMNGGNDVKASLDALRTLYLTAPDHGNQLVMDSLPALRSILDDTRRSVEVYRSALHFLKEIAQRASNMIVPERRIIQSVINRLSPRHDVLDVQCRQFIFVICQQIAQNSDDGRKALIEKNILPILLDLAADSTASNVVNACNILKALAHTGTYRSALMSAGVRDAMERFTSIFSKSKLTDKEDKQRAQGAAKQVLSVLKSTKGSPGSPIASNISRTSNTGRETSSQSPPLVTDSGIRASHLRRTASESAVYTDHYPTSVPDGEAEPVHVTSPTSPNSFNSSSTSIGDTMRQRNLSGRNSHLRRSVSESTAGTYVESGGIHGSISKLTYPNGSDSLTTPSSNLSTFQEGLGDGPQRVDEDDLSYIRDPPESLAPPSYRTMLGRSQSTSTRLSRSTM